MARIVHIEVDSRNAVARRLYEREGGFVPAYAALKYMQEF
jgi:hypothetical protein